MTKKGFQPAGLKSCLAFRAFIFLTGFLPFLSSAQTPHLSEVKAGIHFRLNTYIDKNKSLGEFYAVTDAGMSVYASPADKKAGKPEFFVPWDKLGQYYDLLKEPEPLKAVLAVQGHPERWNREPALRTCEAPSALLPLKGVRIALDPGHTAGTIASGKVEQKFLDIPKDSFKGVASDIKLVEGHLTLSTALMLKKKLEEAGAIVMMTHSRPDETAFGKSYQEWKKQDFNRVLDSLAGCKFFSREQKQFYKTKADDRKIFREVFRDLELAKRAELIHRFRPDLTVIIHFNVDEKNAGWKKLSEKDYVMAFIGGAMLPHDMSQRNSRFEFLRMALTDDLNKSEQASAAIVNSFSSVLQVPAATSNDAKYLHDNCLPTPSKGVYCRNLILTRIIGGPLVYGETLYQDNKKEAFALGNEDLETEGIKSSQRTRDIAEAYYKGILKYFGK